MSLRLVPVAHGRPNSECFLSIADLRARWSCSKTFVYVALAEMARDGYLRRLRLGRVQRIAVESVEQYEAEHMEAAPPPRAQQRATRAPSAGGVGAAIRALKVA